MCDDTKRSYYGNMSVITDNLIDAFIKVAQVQAAGGIIVTVDDGRLAMQLRGF